MPLFVTTVPTTHGAYAYVVPPPALIQPTGTGNSIIVGQFPWGPSEALTYPGSMGAFWNTFAPPGMTRTGSAHLSTIRKGWPSLGAVRVEGAAAVASTATISSSVPTTLFTATAKYPGTAGNSIILTVGTANDGNANHFNLTVSVSSASGTTQEIYPNLDCTGAGTLVINVSNSLLLASVVQIGGHTGVPVAGSTTMSTGSDGSITSSLYVGTPGGNDNGFALLEADDTIDHVFTDDPGNSTRAAVNAGLNAHGILMQDRMVYINGNSGQSAASAQTDAGNYRSINSVYVDPWAYVFDDTTGAMDLCPSSCWAASVAAQLPPSVSIAWKADFVKGLMVGIAQLEFNRGAFRGQNTASGICTLINAHKGGVAFEAGVNTSLTVGQTNITRTRMGIYIARSAVDSWYPYVDAPNVPFFQQDLINSLNNFLFTLKNNQKINPAVLPYILNYTILPTSASNTATTQALGQFTVQAQVQLGSSMSQLLLGLQYGESVVVQAA